MKLNKKLFGFFLALVMVLGYANVSYADNRNDDSDKNRGSDNGSSVCDNGGNFWGNWWRRSKCPQPETVKPPVVYIFATKYSIRAGNSTELYLKTKNQIDSCTASGGWSGSKSADVEEDVSPAVTTTYTITCQNSAGSYSDSVEIYVKPAKGNGTTTPPATTTPETATLTFNGSPLSIVNGSSTTLTWSSSNTNYCLASNAWSGDKSTSGNQIVSPSATSTYTLSCGGTGGTTTESVTIDVTAAPVNPPANVDHLLISEVYYDVGTGKGAEPANEWIELYNGTGAAVDISNWSIGDTSGDFDLIPAGTTIPNNSFLLITDASTTPSFWSGQSMIALEKTLGNAFGNTSDAVYLRNTASTTIDAMSYGTDVNVFNPAAPDVASGHSLKRSSITADNNTAADWTDNASPTPGSL